MRRGRSQQVRKGDHPENVSDLISQRKDRNRAVLSRGPIIRTLEITSLIFGVCSIIALVFALTIFQGQLNSQQVQSQINHSQIKEIQIGREKSAYDVCAVFQRVIFESVAFAPKKNRTKVAKRADDFLRDVNLDNCHKYAKYVETNSLPKLKLNLPLPASRSSSALSANMLSRYRYGHR